MLGNAIGTFSGQSSLSLPASLAVGLQRKARPAQTLSPVDDNNSIMPGTCDRYKPEKRRVSREVLSLLRLPRQSFLMIRNPWLNNFRNRRKICVEILSLLASLVAHLLGEHVVRTG
jgi:hypothetical protein